MMALTPKNWKGFQHYSDRKPSWIKLHRALLDDYQFIRLPLASQALAPRLWLLASEYEGGRITADLNEIAFRMHVTVDVLADALKPLVDAGFFIDDSEPLAGGKQSDCLEKERETQVETEKEETSSSALRAPSGDDVRQGTLKRKRATKLPLPDDWKPSPVHYAKAKQLGLSAEIVDGRAEDLRIWAGSNDIRKANWDMTFHGFLRRAANESKPNGYRGSRPLQDDSRSASRAASRLAEAAERGDFEFGPRPGLRVLPEENANTVVMLPKGRSA